MNARGDASAKGPVGVAPCFACVSVLDRGQGRAEAGPGDFHKAVPCTTLLVRSLVFQSLGGFCGVLSFLT